MLAAGVGAVLEPDVVTGVGLVVALGFAVVAFGVAAVAVGWVIAGGVVAGVALAAGIASGAALTGAVATGFVAVFAGLRFFGGAAPALVARANAHINASQK
ncbi:MAG TPA: hypothetical protein VGL13_02850 [Polyangiaceae bacterium]